MENLVTATCSLCLSVSHENCDIIDKHARDILGILLPKWNLDEGKYLICNECTTKLFAAFNFKGACVNTENRIFPYVNSQKGSLDLREIFLKEIDSELSISEFPNVCRLCMQLIIGKFKCLEQLDVDMLYTFVPKIIFSPTKNPVICNACYEAFKSHCDFLTICLENQKKIKYDNDGVSYLKTEEVDLEPEEIHLKIEETDGSDLEEASHDTEKECKFEIDNNHQQQSLVHNASSEIPIYACDECSFKTEYKLSLRSHKLVHKNACEINMYICHECSYKTWHKNYLDKHILVHKRPPEKKKLKKMKQENDGTNSLKTEEVDLKSVESNKRYLEEMTLDNNKIKSKVGEPSTENDCNLVPVQMHKCETCTFQTSHASSLRRHQLRHKDSLVLKTYKCDDCSYVTTDNSNLRRHKLLHRDPSEIPMYKCHKCSSQSKYKRYLSYHKLKHSDPSEVQMYECDECNFKTRYKGGLRSHKLMHKDPSEIVMHKCDQCRYETKFKSNLNSHKCPNRINVIRLGTSTTALTQSETRSAVSAVTRLSGSSNCVS